MKLIYTGPTALYLKGIIDFNSEVTYVSMHHDRSSVQVVRNKTKTNNLRIDAETHSFGLFKESFDEDFDIYSDERLLVEINKWPLSQEVKDKAIKTLLNRIVEEKLISVKKKITSLRRGIKIIDQIKDMESTWNNVIKQISEYSDVNEALKDYLLKVIEETNVPIMIKGGTAIELFWTSKRATIDVDTHINKSIAKELVNTLKNKKRTIRFDICELKTKNGIEQLGKKLTINEISKLFDKKTIIKLAFVPITYNSKNPFSEFNIVKLSFNFVYSNIDEIIKEYNITKRSIGIFNASLYTFTKELLLAEKYYSIIVKPENTKRTKDLINIHFLLKDQEKVDIKKFIKWLWRKASSQKNNPFKTWEDFQKLVHENKDKELVKIKSDWSVALKHYNLSEIDFNKTKDKYVSLSNIVLNNK